MNIDTTSPKTHALTINGETFHLKRLSLGQMCAWTKAITAARQDRALKGASPGDRIRIIATMELAEPTIDELLDLSLTLSGAAHVVTTCLARAATEAEHNDPAAFAAGVVEQMHRLDLLAVSATLTGAIDASKPLTPPETFRPTTEPSDIPAAA